MINNLDNNIMSGAYPLERNLLFSISSFFTAPKLKMLGEGRKLSTLHKSLTNIQSTHQAVNYGEAFDILYNIMVNDYRCEYVYKNEIARQLLLEMHSFHEASIFNELEVAGSRADVIIINGTSSVYEIKTEFDSFDRLDGQLTSYKSVFDKIYVVTHRKSISDLRKLIGKYVGIIVLDTNGKLEIIRKAKSNKSKTSPAQIFNMLTKPEYVQIIMNHYGYVPEVSSLYLFDACKTLFCQLSPKCAHDYMLEAMRKRSKEEHKAAFMQTTPDSLKFFAASAKLSAKERVTVDKMLKRRLKIM